MVLRGWRGTVGLLIALALVGGCRRSAAPSGSGGEAETTTLSSGDVAPDFEAADLGGATVKLSALDGRVRLLDFWATWCPPCQAEIPMLNDLHEQYGAAGLSILALSDENAQVVKEFAAEKRMAYTNLVDTSAVAERYGVLGLPTAFLVDRQGKIVETFFGAKPKAALEKRIRTLLGLEPAA